MVPFKLQFTVLLHETYRQTSLFQRAYRSIATEYSFFQRSTLFIFSQKALIYSISCFRCQTLFVFCQRTLANSYEALTSCFPMLHLVYVFTRNLDLKLWSIHVFSSSSFQRPILFVFCRRALTYRCVALASLLLLILDTPRLKSSLLLSFTLFKCCDRAPWHKVVAHLSSSYYTNPKARQVCFVG